MFRFTTQVKGIVIDADSIDEDISVWKNITQQYSCLFLTSDVGKEEMIRALYGECTCLLDPYQKFLVPNQHLHIKVLENMKLKFTEIVYVSADFDFIIRGLSFTCAMIWIGRKTLTYKQASTCPDLICDSIEELERSLNNTSGNYFGEAIFSQNKKGGPSKVILTYIEAEGQQFDVFSLGRYYGNKHYMHPLQPYSSAILQNKNPQGTVYKIINEKFEKAILQVVRAICNRESVDCVCSVPARIGKENRFTQLTSYVAENTNLENIGGNLINCKPYPTQKGLSAEERRRNIKGAFAYNGKLNGKSIILIDDILVTGSTLVECAKVLQAQGARDVYFVVMGINQQEIPYWSSRYPAVLCPKCNSEMKLFLSRKLDAFYSCIQCPKETLAFQEGVKTTEEHVGFDIKFTDIEPDQDNLYCKW